MHNFVHKKVLFEFYENLKQVKSKKKIRCTVMSRVNGNSITLDEMYVAIELRIPCEG